MNHQPKDFYKSQLEIHLKERSRLQKVLAVSSTIRLIVFVALVLLLYFLWGNYQWLIPLLVVGIAAFLFLVSRHSRLQYQKKLTQAGIDYYKRELRVLDRDFYHLDQGMDYRNPTHEFSHDIDLFGKGSFFQYLNRTATQSGSDELAKMLLSNDTNDIMEKQEAIKELGNLAEWRKQFYAIASLVKTETSTSAVIKWLSTFQSFTPSFTKVLVYGFSVISLASMVASYFGWISIYVVFGIFGVGLLISSKYFKKIGVLASHTTQIQSTFDQYAKLIQLIEEQEMDGSMLAAKRKEVINTTTKTSDKLTQFSKLLDTLDQRNNIFVALFANGFFLRDIWAANRIENWVRVNADYVPKWFETIAFFDAFASLGNYTFNHPDFTFPEIISSDVTLKSEAAFHPLLDPEQAVPSSFTMNRDTFFIVTGANMAGKSTFLRTVALHIVMSNVGLPLSAKKVSYNPIKLITSMRTTDSLTDDESYFFSELKRLKYIIDKLDVHSYFIILDEILKGTNSTDKAIGSRKFIDKLVRLKSTGIIATHDLSLTKAGDELETVENYFFDAQIVDDELFFDYSLKKGICQNMNASFLLKKMGIVE